MKKHLLTALLPLSFSTAALADCWMECMARNPFSGKCIAKTKMCNLEDGDKAIKSLGADVSAAYANLKDEWVRVYGYLPPQLQSVLDKYPLTIAMAIFPGTREYALFTAGLETYTGRAKKRSQDLAPIIAGAPDWKKDLAHDAENFMLFFEGVELGNADFSGSVLNYLPEKYDQPWFAFVGCLAGASDREAGDQCYKNSKRDTAIAG